MAASQSPSSSQDPSNPLSAPPAAVAGSSTRRLPPPCWSNDETVALIDAYRDKWYSLRRGNLRASHWQEVADGVAARCPLSSGNPPKTSTQCRHKMEKLRKRYRAEIQRVSAAAAPKGQRFPSSWVHFKRMDSMESGSNSSDLNNQDDDEEEEDDEKDDDNPDELLLYPRGIKQAIPIPISTPTPLNHRFHNGNGNGNGVRIKIPGQPPPPPPAGLYDDYPPPTNRRYGSGKGSGDGCMKEWGRRRREEEVVEAIKSLADGFVRIEKMKMEMARELESMRMESEMKRTEMILESQQRLLEAVLEPKNKKAKRMPTP